MDSNYNYKVISTLRVKDGLPYVELTFKQLKELTERILILDDNSTDGTYEFLKSKVPSDDIIQKSLNEYEARSFLWQWAGQLKPKWVLSLDADEIFEDKIFKIWDSLFDDVEALAFSFPFFHIYTEGYFRCDGLWSPFHFRNVRLCRYINRSIHNLSHTLSHTFPLIPEFNLRFAPCKILHYGYSTPEIRQKKYNFYKKIIEKYGPSPLFLGKWVDYYKQLYKKTELEPLDHIKHIIDEEHLQLGKLGKGTISWNLISNNPNPHQINIVKKICDEIVLVSPKKQGIEGVKEIVSPWLDDFSKMRNLAKQHTTTQWILRLDDDEAIDINDLFQVWLYAQFHEFTGYVFQIKNKLPNNGYFITQTIRLFQNFEDIYYSRPVHEEIDISLKGKDYKISQCPVIITHFGYLKDQRYLEEKFKYYHLLNQKWLEQHPDDFYPYFSMAVHFKHINQKDKAIEYYRKALDLNPKCFLAYLGLAEIYEEEKNYISAIKNYIKTIKTNNSLKPANFDRIVMEKIWDLLKRSGKAEDFLSMLDTPD